MNIHSKAAARHIKQVIQAQDEAFIEQCKILGTILMNIQYDNNQPIHNGTKRKYIEQIFEATLGIIQNLTESNPYTANQVLQDMYEQLESRVFKPS